jgi:hypothetical protein
MQLHVAIAHPRWSTQCLPARPCGRGSPCPCRPPGERCAGCGGAQTSASARRAGRPRRVPPRRAQRRSRSPSCRGCGGATAACASRARGVVIGSKTYRRLNDKPRGRRSAIFKDHWAEMAECLEDQPDQTALELLVEFQARYPGHYSLRQLHTLQRRVRAWRQQAVQRLIGETSSSTLYIVPDPSSRASG